MKDIRIEIISDSGVKKIQVRPGETILSAIHKSGFFMNAFCGGQGLCGKCKIQVLDGEIPSGEKDKKFFTAEELDQGYRLACSAIPVMDCSVRLSVKDESDIEVVTEGGNGAVLGKILEWKEKNSQAADKMEQFGIAIDIGTTTIAMQLLNRESGTIQSTWTMLNPQRCYGADVVSRIHVSNEGKGHLLQKMIKKALYSGIEELIKRGMILYSQITQIVIAANATMIHLLMGYSCETLGVFPFTPVNMDTIILHGKELFGDAGPDCEVRIIPGICTYVGGDIVSGLFSVDILQKTSPCLLIDLGTNGEMALGSGEHMLVTSVAAGPAFEGGNISCGIGSIPGAICGYRDGKIRTIGEKAPIGLCGTGVIEVMAELIEKGLVDETGLLDDEFFEEGFPLGENLEGEKIMFCQKDIREVQLAKSAVRAGLEVLLRKYGIGYEAVGAVYLAGGFGYRMSPQRAVTIGMIPEALLDKIQAVGNCALSGAKQILLQEEKWGELERIVKSSEEVMLSSDKAFHDLYVKHMYFGDGET